MKQEDKKVLYPLICSLVGTTFIVIASILGAKTLKGKPIEYSSKEYTLEYKITEYREQRDTVYVLIPKEMYNED